MTEEEQILFARIALHTSAIVTRCATELSKAELLSEDARETIADNLQKIADMLDQTEVLGIQPQAAKYHLAARAVRETNRRDGQS